MLRKKENETVGRVVNAMENYDSSRDVMVHQELVRAGISAVCKELFDRGHIHDNSKLESPEKEMFDEFTPKLKQLEYGSEEYKKSLEDMGEALAHHYENNSHHPEHFENGISGMSLIDIIEMLCDWKASCERTSGGDINKSVDINIKRFGIDDQLASIIKNTLSVLEKGYY